MRHYICSIILLLHAVVLMGNEGTILTEVGRRYYNSNNGDSTNIKIQKVFVNGEISYRITGGNVQSIDEVYALEEEDRLYRELFYGPIKGKLQQWFNESLDSDEIEIEATFSVPVTPEVITRFSLIRDSVKTCITCDEKKLIVTAQKSSIVLMKSDPEVLEIHRYEKPTPLSGGDENCSACTKDNIMTPDDVIKILMDLPEGVTEVPQWGKGYGVKCATDEGGVHSGYLDSLTQRYGGTHGVIELDDLDDHSNGCFGGMCRVAQKATWYHSREGFGGMPDYMKQHGIETISRSYGFSSDPNKKLVIDFDKMIYSSGVKPLFTACAANDGIFFPAGGKAYNHISVGGATLQMGGYFEIQVLDTKYFHPLYDPSLWNDSTKQLGRWVNIEDPHLKETKYRGYGNPHCLTQCQNPLLSTTTKTDRELPHLVSMSHASCTGVYEDILMKMNSDIKWQIGGTSYAAPTVNGLAACVIGTKPTKLKNNPLTVKAILMNTAVNIDGGYWNPQIDGRDGCGVISGYDALTFAHDSAIYFDNTFEGKAVHGVAYGDLPKDFASKKFTYRVKTPQVFDYNRHFRAVLTWASSIDTVNEINEISDLDLILRDSVTNEIIDICASVDDNVEVIDVESWKLKPNHTYILECNITSLRFLQNGINDKIYYSVTWTYPKNYKGKNVLKGAMVTDEHQVKFLNRNLVAGPFDVTTSGEVEIAAQNTIVLKAGTSIKNGAKFHGHIDPTMIAYRSNSNRDRSNHDRDAITNGSYDSGISKYTHTSTRYFRGDGGHIEVNKNHFSPSDFKNGLTIASMINIEDHHNGGPIFSLQDSTGEHRVTLSISKERLVELKMTTFDQVYTYTYGVTDKQINRVLHKTVNYTNVVPQPRWINIVARWERGKDISFFINYKKVHSVTSGVPQMELYNVKEMFLAKEINTPSPTFHGAIGEFTLFGGALSDETILGLHRYGNWPHYRGENKTLTLRMPNLGGTLELSGRYDPLHNYGYAVTEDKYSFSAKKYTTVIVTPKAENGYTLTKVERYDFKDKEWKPDILKTNYDISMGNKQEYQFTFTKD